MAKFIRFLQDYSIPLIVGVLAALIWANLDYDSYHGFLEYPLGFDILGHPVTFHFIINDIFMVLFFGIAGVEITTAALPGGSLNPPSKAVNPLLGTLGGVVGPVATFFVLCKVFPLDAIASSIDPNNFTAGKDAMGTILNGWGIPTATDIALAWLVARLVFGNSHPAVSYLLLLAVADDAIGLGIIAIFYPSPLHPVAPMYLGFTVLGMAIAFGLRKMNVKNMWLYFIFGGFFSWLGLIMAHLHPALALVFIVPFMPADEPEADDAHDSHGDHKHSTLITFEHTFKGVVDFGLFGFGLANAGVLLEGINNVTWIILGALIAGKAIGITGFGLLGHVLGAKLPKGMNVAALFTAGIVAGLGLTVALFVAGEAYADPILQGAAKMGALLSVLAAPIAIVIGKIFRLKSK